MSSWSRRLAPRYSPPGAARIAVLVNPADATLTEPQSKEVTDAGRTMGLQIQIHNANTSTEINAAFEAIARERPDAVVIGSTPFLNGRQVQLAQLAAFHRLPAISALRDYAEAGGLMSYGSNIVDSYRQAGSETNGTAAVEFYSNVSLWHKADIPSAPQMSAFGGKADTAA